MSDTSMINLALTRARDLSRRAGIGWALIDDNQQLLHYDACMAGLDAGKLESTIRQYGDRASELFISSEPTTVTFDLNRLTQIIETSSIQSIRIGRGFNGSIVDSEWRRWLQNWKGSVIQMPFNPVIEKLSLGIQLLHSSRRPWVTSVTAADLSGKSRSMSAFIQEFDFLNYIAVLARQSRAVLVSPAQQDLIEHLPEDNHANEPLEYFEIFDDGNVEAILRHCANEYRCSILVLADIPLLSHLLNQGLVDEVVHHLTNNSHEHYGENEPHMAHSPLKLDGWKLQSSSVVGHCNRMIYGKPMAYPPQEDESGRRLN